MTALVIGLAVLVLWPLYNIALATYASAAAPHAGRGGAGRARAPRGIASGHSEGESSSAAEAAPTTYWIIVPCLNEERVIAHTARSALALTPPAGAQARVLVVDDDSDDATAEVLAGIRSPRLDVLHRRSPDARRGKGAALNAAYQLIGEWVAAAGDDPARHVIGVIDGDGQGSANMLTEVGGAMLDSETAAVQCRVRIRNRSRLLAVVQDIEFGSVADANQTLRDALRSVGLGGNGQFVRLSALQSLGATPWSDCLVEDLELGLRLHLTGARIRYTPRAAIFQQAPVTVRRLLRQRTRWAQGNLQCIRYLRKLFNSRRIPNHTFVEMTYYLLAPWLNAVGAVAVAGFWGFTAARLASDASLSASAVGLAVVLGLWTLLMLAPGLLWASLHRVRLGDESWWRCLLGGVAYPFLLVLSLVSTWRALGRQLSGRRGWVKTERLPELTTTADAEPAPQPADGPPNEPGAEPPTPTLAGAAGTASGGTS